MGQVEAIRVLVEADVNIEAKTAEGATPLHMAASLGQVEAIQTLAELGTELEAKADDGRTR